VFLEEIVIRVHPGIGLVYTPPSFSRLPPILSVLEDSPAGVVERSNGRIPVEDDSQPEHDTDGQIGGTGALAGRHVGWRAGAWGGRRWEAPIPKDLGC
jgi:hypothetical protein